MMLMTPRETKLTTALNPIEALRAQAQGLIAGSRWQSRASLPPAASPIETTSTEQKNDDDDDKKRGCVHDF
jgi:hypothetical protein